MMMTIKEWWSNTVQVCGTWWWSRNNYCAPPFPPSTNSHTITINSTAPNCKQKLIHLKFLQQIIWFSKGGNWAWFAEDELHVMFSKFEKCLEIRGWKNTGCFFSDCTRVWLALLLKLVSSGSIVGVKVDLISPRCLVRVPLSGTMLRLLCDWGTIFTFTLPFDGSGDRSRQVFISGAGQLDLVLKATLVN